MATNQYIVRAGINEPANEFERAFVRFATTFERPDHPAPEFHGDAGTVAYLLAGMKFLQAGHQTRVWGVDPMDVIAILGMHLTNNQLAAAWADYIRGLRQEVNK